MRCQCLAAGHSWRTRRDRASADQRKQSAVRRLSQSEGGSPVGAFGSIERRCRYVTCNDRPRIGMRKGQGDQSEFGEQSEDHSDMAHAAVKIGTGVIVLLGFLVLMIMMTHMRGHRIMLVLAIRTHRRCSCLQGQHGDQQKTEEGSHAAECTSFAKHDHSGFTRTAMKKSCEVGQIDTSSNRSSRWPMRSHDARASLH